MDNLCSVEQKTQENEKRITALENTLRESEEMIITREEYNAVEAIMRKMTCDGLITSGDYFDALVWIVFTKFFVLQPVIVEVLTEAAKNADAGTKDNIRDFVKELSFVNKTLCNITENHYFFETLVMFLEQLEKAKRCYTR